MPSDLDPAPALRRIIHVDMDAFYAFVEAQAALEQVSLDLPRPLLPSRLGVRLLEVTLSNLEAAVQSGPAQFALGLG